MEWAESKLEKVMLESKRWFQVYVKDRAYCKISYPQITLGCTEWVHHPDNLSIKYHEQKFCIKFAFSGQHWTGISIRKCKKFLMC